jgi:hypothetical protein
MPNTIHSLKLMRVRRLHEHKNHCWEDITSYDTIVFQTLNLVVSLDLEKSHVANIHPADAGILIKASPQGQLSSIPPRGYRNSDT